ncbi:hypothetical protein E1218_17425 [Kribbella turkmenica]|uniref:Uncharacterized protein n=1 Tax=Kribbella turkmenica TaxID=2530375 RepID=A0A4R4X0P4_9ACTN|nr:hypothetical protein [Kribbella turkmenica]TDD23738.1 hypothetical protein E1218_17425 [Kribbella turkmenica]
MALGTTIHGRAEEKAARQRALLHPVRARTLENTAGTVPSSPGHVTSPVRIGWLEASGVSRVGTADVMIGTMAGTGLTVWLDRSGTIVPAPRESAGSAASGTAAAMMSPMLAWPLLWASFRLALRPLDRRRADAWAREWAQVSARWTRAQRSPVWTSTGNSGTHRARSATGERRSAPVGLCRGWVRVSECW